MLLGCVKGDCGMHFLAGWAAGALCQAQVGILVGLDRHVQREERLQQVMGG